jgi:glycosyltransferase involved in cell wall biosynthesis
MPITRRARRRGRWARPGTALKLPALACPPVTRLSVISPIFNAGLYLEEMLDSVASLAVPVEHIVVDGGSSDGTVALLEARDDERLRWVSEPDRGQTHAVNKGLVMATGDLLTWMNGDNAYLPGAIERAVELMSERPDLDAVFGGIDIVDEDGEVRRRYIPPPYSWQRYLFMGDYIPTETVVFRRALLEAAPALDERFVDAADYDFFLRLLHGRRVHRMREPVLRYRYHPDSKTARDPWLAQAEHMVIRRQWARGRRDLLMMEAFDRAKRAVLPRISSWPRPYAP